VAGARTPRNSSNEEFFIPPCIVAVNGIVRLCVSGR
jgi:hypothetical protein